MEKKIEELSFEEAMEQLEQIVKKLEEGTAPLEDLLAQYETGSRLMRRCNTLLENAKQRVQIIENGEETDFLSKEED